MFLICNGDTDNGMFQEVHDLIYNGDTDNGMRQEV